MRSENAEMRHKNSRSETKVNISSVRSSTGGVLNEVTSPADILRLYQSSVETDSPLVRAKFAGSERNGHEHSVTKTDPSTSIGDDFVSRKSVKRKGAPCDDTEYPMNEENQATGSQNSSQSINLATSAHL